MAGQDTTASAITWMVKYLDENPKALKKLRVITNISSVSIHVTLFEFRNLNESILIVILFSLSFKYFELTFIMAYDTFYIVLKYINSVLNNLKISYLNL